MGKNVLIISSSFRRNSNSAILAHEFEKGAKAAGHNVDFVSLFDKTINFCRGCLACVHTQVCINKDDSNAIVEKMRNSDVIVFATPIYYYQMSGQLKTLLDRANPLYSSKYKFREIYLISTAADTDTNADEILKNSLNGWLMCFPNVEFKGSIFGAGADNAGEIANHTAILEEAYKLGTFV